MRTPKLLYAVYVRDRHTGKSQVFHVTGNFAEAKRMFRNAEDFKSDIDQIWLEVFSRIKPSRPRRPSPKRSTE